MMKEPGTPGEGNSIPLCVPDLSGREREYINSCLETNWVSSAGPFVDRFEAAFARTVGARHAVSFVNGTSALHLAIQLAGVQPGEEVLVSSLTFIASANAVVYAGACPVFVDAEPRYWQMDLGLVREFLSRQCQRKNGRWWNRQTGRAIGALLPVHVLGHPVDVTALRELQAEFELPVVEDAAEALGSQWQGQPIGSHGNLACFSFNGNKIITTGGGGMLVTDDPELAARAKYLTTQAKDDPVEYIHHEVGYNYRLPNLLAAMGYGQLECLEQKLVRKGEIAERYRQAFAELEGIDSYTPAPQVGWNGWLAAITLDPQHCPVTSRELMRQLSAAGIQSRPLWQPLHQSRAFSGSPALGGSVAERLNARTLCLPCSTSLTDAEQDRVIDAVQRSLLAQVH